MAQRQIPLRVDEAVHAQLKVRSSITHRSINEIIGEAIRENFEAHPVSREDMLTLVRSIVKDDAELLKALAEA
jgi:hypothetical protein